MQKKKKISDLQEDVIVHHRHQQFIMIRIVNVPVTIIIFIPTMTIIVIQTHV